MSREPFGEILASTLSEYWAARYGEVFRVEWASRELDQVWWGNSYLNFFATSGTPEQAFSVLRREYSHSRAGWRRPLQQFYAHAATTFPVLRWLSNAAFSVTPGVPDAGKVLVLGANHRLRLLEPERACSVVILKKGFDPRHIQLEMELRTALNPACAPRLTLAETGNGWFEEAYVVGTPINRLSESEGRKGKEDAVRSLWAQVVRPSMTQISAEDWAARILKKFRQLVARCDAPGGSALLQLAKQMAETVVEELRGESLPFSWTHGDFQEANIIIDESKTWVIDWESADHRFAAYDFFQIATGARWTDSDWPNRVARITSAKNSEMLQSWLNSMLEMWCKHSVPRVWVLAYLVEELLYRAQNDEEQLFYTSGSKWMAIHQSGREVLAAL